MANRWTTGRTEAFSDGVFAIAITLLVLDISVPESDFHDLWRGIANQWPSYLGYVTSFLTIGGIWMAHHGLFRRMRYADQNVMRLNILLLMVVSFLPFPTRLVAETVRDANAERPAVMLYGFTLLATSVLLSALWHSVLRDRALLNPGVTDADIAAVTRLATPNIGFYIVATILAWRVPTATVVLYLVIGAGLVLRAPGDQRSAVVA